MATALYIEKTNYISTKKQIKLYYRSKWKANLKLLKEYLEYIYNWQVRKYFLRHKMQKTVKKHLQICLPLIIKYIPKRLY